MELVELTKEIVTSLATDKDSVEVKEFDTDEENTVLIQVMVSNDDAGRVIGRGGKNINAIRTILKASSSLHDHKYINLNVESF